MKVLMIAPQPFFEPRGTPISIYQRLHGLSTLGHEVDLLTIHVGMDVDIPNVTIHRTMRIPFIKRVAIGPSPAKLFLDVLLFFKLFRMLLTSRYDVVHSHEEAAFFTMVLSRLFRLPHVYDMHSSLPKQLQNFEFGNARPFIKLFKVLEGAVLKSCSVALTVGADLEAHIDENYPETNHIRVENTAIHNSLPYDENESWKLRRRLGLEEDQFVVVYTGNFEKYQGVDLLLQAARQVLEEAPRLVLVLVGGKPEQIRARQAEVDEMGMAEYVIFTGTVSLTKSLLYLSIADALASPRTEGLSIPLKVYSYLYSGKPTLATNIYAHTQLLTDEIALLVAPTVEAYAEGLQRLYADPALGARLGENAAAFARENFSINSYLAKLEQAYLAASLSKSVEEIAVALTDGRIRSTVG